MLRGVQFCGDEACHQRKCNTVRVGYNENHTSVLIQPDTCFGVCWEALNLLHVLSRGNHNPMIVERLNRFLNEGLGIMTKTSAIPIRSHLRQYFCSFMPGIPAQCSQSMVAIGQEFAFQIDFLLVKHTKLYSTPGIVESYAKQLADRLSSCHMIADLLVCKQRCWHRKLVNSP
jgi:hypothetical protein